MREISEERARDGTITTFDAAGSNGTLANGINAARRGRSRDSTTSVPFKASSWVCVYHGFLRAPDGTITSFDAPGACSASTCGGSGTYGVMSINPAGAITGSYFDPSDLRHGFLRAPDGTFTTVDAPGAGTGGAPQGTGGHKHQPSRGDHGILRRREQCVSRPPGRS